MIQTSTPRRFISRVAVAIFLVPTALTMGQPAATTTTQITRETDIEFAKFGDVTLRIDLHLPVASDNPPLVMFIHGGGWQGGDRKNCKMAWLAEHGYAVASIEYRLSQQATFPAQIHDCKGALRWLRAHQAEYGYDARRVVVAGDSAGGHLAALMGTSGNVAELEGAVAGNLGQSSSVAGAVVYFGASDFLLRSRHQPSKTEDPAGPVYQLLGGPVREKTDLARLASPVTHVDPSDPPLLIIHGELDEVVFPRQSRRLFQAYQSLRLDATLHVVKDKGHGWEPPLPEEQQLILDFLQTCLPR